MRKAILTGTILALTLVAGIALAQYNVSAPPQLYGRPDPELRAARQSLDDALAHLQRARSAGNQELAQARACIEVAESHIDSGFDSLAGHPALPPTNSPPSCDKNVRGGAGLGRQG